jgi:BlaI family penicillinase repressor
MLQEANHPPLSPAEWEIMKTLWEHGPLDARGVFAAMSSDRSWVHQTVKTLLSRLVAKEAITYDQVGNSYLYRAIALREEMTRQEVRTVFDRIVGTAVSPVLAHFLDEANLTDEDIRQLQKILKEKRQKQPCKGRSTRRRKSP